MTLQQFQNEWLGRRVDYDHVYANQCVDLILQYLKECYGISTGVSGNAIDYWTRPSAPLAKAFDRVSGTTAQAGDIAVFYGLAGNPYGHIGIVISQDANNVTVLEQNGATGNGSGTGGDAIRTRAIAKSRLAGLWRYKSSAYTPPSITPRKGTATVIIPVLNVRNQPSTKNPVAATYKKGETFNYDGYITANGYTWLTYVSYSGVRRYVAQGGSDGKYVSGGV